MEVLYRCCCGLDVHKKSITACVLWAEAKGRRKEKRTFGTFTRDLLSLLDWLKQCGVTHVAMESTGVYWKPVWNILEGQLEQVLLVNAQHTCQAAWAVTRLKKHYLAAFYHRLAARRGGKGAIIAVAHALLVMAYHMLQRNVDYRELGPDYFDRLNQRHITNVLVRRLERLGHNVILQPAT